MTKKKILISGANGQVGRSLKQALKSHPYFEGHFYTRQIFNLADENQMLSVLDNLNPDAVINAAAYTQVDLAEEEISTAEKINSEACKILASYCKVEDIPLVHYSTDYVYHNNNSRPLLETDELNPQSIYAKTKLKGEEAIRSIGPRHFIFRTSWVYDAQGNNFVRTMLSLAEKYPALTVVDDQIGSPTYAPDIAQVTLTLLESCLEGDTIEYGTYNFSNEGVCSWYDFAKAIFEITGKEVQVSPVSSTAYPRPAARPPYSVMSKQKIRSILPYQIPHWRESLKVCLKRLS